MTIKNYLFESQLFIQRSITMAVFILLLLAFVVARLVYLQLIQHQHYTTLSQDNRVKLLPLAPIRGLIYDRNGVILAENLPSYSLEVIPEQVKDLDATLTRLSQIITITAEDIKKFKTKQHNKRRFEKIPLRWRLTEEEVARFSVHKHHFPGINVYANLHRHYPLADYTAHILGYVARINPSDLTKIDKTNYLGSTHIGKLGIEKTYESQLHGKVGYQEVEVNVIGRVIRILNQQAPIPGKDLNLYLDINLQRIATQALEDYNGAIVVLDITTGGVIAFVSQPSYNHNLFVNGISYKSYQALQQSPNKPLYNRALKGQYPPGSTVKPFIALAGLEHNIINAQSSSYCPGYYQLPNHDHKYRCWKRHGHGKVNLLSAIAQSCDVYYYELASRLGIDKLHDFMTQFGFGKKTGIDLIGEVAGLMPSRAWKQQRYQQAWFPGETLNTGIGQGFTLATPLQLANATATLARKGLMIPPRIVESITIAQTKQRQDSAIKSSQKITLSSSQYWQQVIHAMQAVVHSRRGSARKISKGLNYTIAGKTGTAQVFSLKQNETYQANIIPKELRDHSLFVAFAPVEQAKVAIAVIAENAGSGSKFAAPIARKVLDAYFKQLSH